MNAPEAAPVAVSAAHRIRRPYPGLRPFLDGEESLLFGRERQVREVIERLRDTQFVAVIGGSGSGKSSLILAGLVPALRSFGIPGAGDFWVPLVCTPGTNATLQDQQQRLNTPITRLARKFAALLRPCATDAATAERLKDIEDTLRQERGLARLVRAYSADLDAPPGPDPQQARVLFVLDQFEELFHPTTRRSDDSRLLIERVIDHFFSPHERCYVVLTMRSEHLNDCASYLELPDAINKASYLVRRLDAEQLRTAITGPAERFLRLRERVDEGSGRLPAQVHFEPAVVDRLLADTAHLDANPDHLPLLQHVLARLWDAALQRVGDRLDLPDRITAEDLATAVAASTARPTPMPGDAVNVLCDCLENWAEATFQRYDPDGRDRIGRLLRRLGVKDPNTGMYSQERVDVDEAARLLSLAGGRDAFEALLRRGFVGDMDYLFWDAVDPERVTVKVSHESFIRGWKRLREAIDDEAERFSAFVDILRKAAKWQLQGRGADELLESGDLRRVDEARLQPVLAEPVERRRWIARLASSNAFARLAQADASVDDFVVASRQRQLARQNKERWRRRLYLWLFALALLALPLLGYWTLVQGPVVERTALMFRAGTLATSRQLPNSQGEVGSENGELASMLRAVATLDRGKQGYNWLTHRNRELVDSLSDWSFVRVQARFIDQVVAGNEPPVNGSLRNLLETWVWRGDPGLKGRADSRIEPARVEMKECLLERAIGAAAAGSGTADGSALNAAELYRESRGSIRGVTVNGTLLTAVNPNAPGTQANQANQATQGTAARPLAARSVFVPAPRGEADQLEIRAATVDASGGCHSRQPILSIPLSLKPRLAFDANLRNLFFITLEGGVNVTTMVEINWERPVGQDGFAMKTLTPVVLQGAAAADQLDKAIRQQSAGVTGVPAVLETHRSPAGRVFIVGDEGWRVIDELAQRVPPPTAAAASAAMAGKPPTGLGLRPLKPLEADGTHPCAQLAQALAALPGGGEVTTRAFVDEPDKKHCFIIQYDQPSTPAPTAPAVAGDEPPQYHLIAAVYPWPTAAQLAANRPGGATVQDDSHEPLPAPIASLPRFGRSANPAEAQWWIGPDNEAGKPYAGWLASWNRDRTRSWRFVAAPWSTCALFRLGREVYEQGGTALVLGRDDTRATCTER